MALQLRRAALPLAAAALAAACMSSHAVVVPRISSRPPLVTPMPVQKPPATPLRAVFGRSQLGRPLVALQVGRRDAPRKILIVGEIHGDETAGRTIALALLDHAPPAATAVVVVPDLNPDGVAQHTRQNARGVDLNRNFPYRWRSLGRRGDQQYSGPMSLSESESRAIAALIRRLRPAVTVWFHQPVGVVDNSGGDPGIARRFARIMGEPLRQLTRYPGSAASWQNNTFAGTTAFVVELPRQVSSELGQRTLRALRDLEA